MNNLRKILFFMGLVLGTFSCSTSNTDPEPDHDDMDRKLILTHWVDNLIVPAYATFQVKLDIMLEKEDAFSVSPGPGTLEGFRLAWKEAYIAWQQVEVLEFGPADKYTLRNFFNIYPADESGIAAAIADPTVNLDLPSAYARQGFPALDYLLNGVGADDESIVAYYTTNPEGAMRLQYVSRITDRMNTLLTHVVAEWSGDYRSTFISKTGLDIGSSMGIVVNAYVLYYERYIRSGKFGIPSGATIASAGVPHPEKVEAYYQRDISRVLARTAHQAAMDFFNGVDPETGEEGPSFKTYLNALGAKDMTSGMMLSAIIDDQFVVVNQALDVLSPSLYDQINTDNDAMIGVYAGMQKMVRMLKVDMTSALSVTITYTDNDGD